MGRGMLGSVSENSSPHVRRLAPTYLGHTDPRHTYVRVGGTASCWHWRPTG